MAKAEVPQRGTKLEALRGLPRGDLSTIDPLCGMTVEALRGQTSQS
jgi:hypothetical protein